MSSLNYISKTYVKKADDTMYIKQHSDSLYVSMYKHIDKVLEEKHQTNNSGYLQKGE